MHQRLLVLLARFFDKLCCAVEFTQVVMSFPAFRVQVDGFFPSLFCFFHQSQRESIRAKPQIIAIMPTAHGELRCVPVGRAKIELERI